MASDELVEKVAEQVYKRERARVRSMVKWASVHGRRREMFIREARSMLALVEAALALLTDERDDVAEACGLDRRLIEDLKPGRDALRAQLDAERGWEYGRRYTRMDGSVYVVDKSLLLLEARPDGHRADGRPYFNHEVVRRHPASEWEACE